MMIVADSNLVVGSSVRHHRGRTLIAPAESVDRASPQPMSSILLDSPLPQRRLHDHSWTPARDGLREVVATTPRRAREPRLPEFVGQCPS
jgi:hypothetical protein